jgi:hypothetical protein
MPDNNLIKQDHRGVKLRIGQMLGFKWFGTAAITIAGIELLRRISKGQFHLARLRVRIGVPLLCGMQSWQPNRTATSHPSQPRPSAHHALCTGARKIAMEAVAYRLSH